MSKKRILIKPGSDKWDLFCEQYNNNNNKKPRSERIHLITEKRNQEEEKIRNYKVVEEKKREIERIEHLIIKSEAELMSDHVREILDSRHQKYGPVEEKVVIDEYTAIVHFLKDGLPWSWTKEEMAAVAMYRALKGISEEERAEQRKKEDELRMKDTGEEEEEEEEEEAEEPGWVA